MKCIFDQTGICLDDAFYHVSYSHGGVEIDFAVCKYHIKEYRKISEFFVIEPLNEKLKVMM